MNELIKELEKQCWSHRVDGTLVDGQLHFDTKKFAELIVRECIRYFNEDYQRDFDTLWREDLSKGIKEHFGVEE